MTNRYQSSVSLRLKRALILTCLLCFAAPFAMSQTPTQLSISGVQVLSTKVYDGNTLAGIADSGIVTGIAAGDDVHVTYLAHYASAGVGTNKTVTVTYALYGAQASNYELNDVDFFTADITPAQLTMTGVSVAPTKPYDRNTSAGIVSYGELGGVISGESVSCTRTPYYLDANVGTNKPVEIRYTIADFPGLNYAQNYVAPKYDTVYADITALQLGISGVAIDTTKVYDHNRNCHIASEGTFEGVLPGDIVFHSETPYAQYQDSNVGVNKPVDITFTIGGSSASNYLAPLPMILYADITPKDITLDSFAITPSRVYNGKRLDPILNGGVLRGVYAGDTVTCSSVALFDTPDARHNKPVTVTHTLGGPMAANYNLVDTTTYTATVVPFPLTSHGVDVQKVKQWDGTDYAEVLVPGTIDSLFVNDTVNIYTTAKYDTPEAGHGKDITATYTIDGPQSHNYFAPAEHFFCNDGVIIAATIMDGAANDPLNSGLLTFGTIDDEGVFTAATSTEPNYCQATEVGLKYSVLDGEPTMYTLNFDDAAVAQGFVNAQGLTGLTYPVSYPFEGVINFTIPTTCKEGRYGVQVSFVNDANVSYDVATVYFYVNMSNAYLVQLFCDVISVDNSGALDGMPNRFDTYQWYKNGAMIDGATKAYYQDPEGLNGEYSVLVNKDSVDENYICPMSNFRSCPTEKIVYAYPNPVANIVTIDLEGFDEGTHTLNVFSNTGLSIFTTTFTEDKYPLDMTAMAPGTYMITVDGVSVKVIKL